MNRKEWMAARKTLLQPHGIARAVFERRVMDAKLAVRLAVNIPPDLALSDPSLFRRLSVAAMSARLAGEV